MPEAKEVDLGNWPRARHYALYAGSEYPYVGFSADIELGGFIDRCREKNAKFFAAFMFAVIKAVNAVENFRYRIVDNRVLLFDRIDPSFTVFDGGEKLFYFATAGMAPDFAAFDESARLATEKALAEKCLENRRQDVVHISSVPWFSFRDVIQPIPIGSPTSVPKIMWGKYETRSGTTTVPFSITAHHGLADGYHVGELFAAIAENVKAF